MADPSELTVVQDSSTTTTTTTTTTPAVNDDYSCFSDSEAEDRPPQRPPSRSTPDILSGVYRGIKKLPSVKLSRGSSFLSKSNSSTSVNSTNSSKSASRLLDSSALQHVRNLKLQHSLAKPLPQTPPIPQAESPPPPPPSRHTLNEKELPILLEEADDGDISDFDLHPFTPSAMDSRTSTMDSSTSVPLAVHPYGNPDPNAHDMSSSMSSLSSARYEGPEDPSKPRGAGGSSGPSPAGSQGRTPTSVGGPSQPGPSAHLSGLMCNVHRTTGREPHALVGATTTILGDKLYVFGGRILSRSRPAPLTSDLYELDLIRRHWTKLETTGDIPPPRYFHSMCALGDTKMVCYGGMSPAPNQPPGADPQQPEITVMSDIYIYDVTTKAWTFIPTQEAPQGRYAHCACILPSSATFSSHRAPLSALQHNPSSGNPNEGRIGININGSGGAEMVIVGGQDGGNNYIEQISVFNLRSLKWTTTQSLGKSCGAYRSVAAPLPPSVSAKLGRSYSNGGLHGQDGGISQEAREAGSSMLIYSNYNFLDVKLELQIRSPDGTLAERPMSGTYSPPGLRFPNGGVIDTHFVVSGTYLTSSKQEYALWALDLRTLTWSRIDAGGSVFSQGSWNRGVLWNRRNTFVILGNRKRSLVDDYNHRRINFSNVCMVELEAFGFYDNPRKTTPMSGFISASSPYANPGLSLARKAGYTAGGRFHSKASEELGEKAFTMRELADMDILCIGGERIPVNSRIVGRRWGPYFVQLLREGTATQDGSDAMTLRSGLSSNPLRASAITITPNNTRPAESTVSLASTLVASTTSGVPPSAASSVSAGVVHPTGDTNPNAAPTPRSLPPNSRPRCLYLPHTYLTVQALLHFLYTSSLPPQTSPLCTPQILCSLLQIARPYRIDGLLEAVVERLHALLDSRNAAAVFNATAMAAGGGRGIDGSLNPNFFIGGFDPIGSPTATSDFSMDGTANTPFLSADITARTEGLSINTSVQRVGRPPSEELSASTSASGSEWSSSEVEAGSERDNFVWNGELSSVIGLQKRGLRGLMEGRRMRERTGTAGGNGGYAGGPQRVGLGIAGS